MQRRANRTIGMGTATFLDSNGDRVSAAYGLYRVEEEGEGAFTWKLRATYRTTGFPSSGLTLIP